MDFVQSTVADMQTEQVRWLRSSSQHTSTPYGDDGDQRIAASLLMPQAVFMHRFLTKAPCIA